MFGKNYDQQINDLIEMNGNLIKVTNNIAESVSGLQKFLTSFQESMITMAKIQAQHKAIIIFLVNHAQLDADEETKEDLSKMMKDIMKTEKEVKK